MGFNLISSFYPADIDIPWIFLLTCIPDAQDITAGPQHTPDPHGKPQSRVPGLWGTLSTPSLLSFPHQGHQGRIAETFTKTAHCCGLPQLRSKPAPGWLPVAAVSWTYHINPPAAALTPTLTKIWHFKYGWSVTHKGVLISPRHPWLPFPCWRAENKLQYNKKTYTSRSDRLDERLNRIQGSQIACWELWLLKT